MKASPAMVSAPARHPASVATAGAMAATIIAPPGTPVCLRLKIRLRRCGGTRLASRWLPAGVTGPCPSPAMSAEAASAAGVPIVDSAMPAPSVTSAPWQTRMPPKRRSSRPVNGPETSAPA